MIDSPDNTAFNVESEELNQENKTIDTTEDNESKEILDDNVSTEVDASNNTAQSETEAQMNESSEIVNCLALTVKKDYNLSVVKNVVLKTFKNAWRIALSIFTLNFIKFFF